MNLEIRNAAPLLPLETDRLTIRQYREEDAQAYFRLYSNPRVSCFLGEKTDSLEAARREVGQRMLLKDGSELAVCLKETGEWIGTVFGMWEGDTFSVHQSPLPSPVPKAGNAAGGAVPGVRHVPESAGRNAAV